jgi:hypothetical protein
MATGNIRRTIQNYDGSSGGFRNDLDSIELAIYDARVRDRAKQDRIDREVLRRKQAREQEAQRLARAEAREHENRERMKQTKAEEKRRCIAAGMTASDFETSYWPTRKFEIIKERIDAQVRAQATDGMYQNVL